MHFRKSTNKNQAPAQRRAGDRRRGRRLKLRYREVTGNNAWLKRRTAVLNLRTVPQPRPGPPGRRLGASRLTGIGAQWEGRHAFEDLGREHTEQEIVRMLKAPKVTRVRCRVQEK